MKENNSTFPLPPSHYLFSFIAIQILFMVGGNYLTSQLLFLCNAPSNPLILYGIQHAPFFLLLVLLLLFIRVVHHSTLLSFITDHPRFNIRGFSLGLSVWFIGMIINSSINVIFFHEPILFQYDENVVSHMYMFLLAIVCSPVQAFCEEVLFRSFFYRAFQKIVHNKYIVATISALFFTLAHSLNRELLDSSTLIPVLLYYFLSGFFFMLLIYHYRGIEVALGAHIMNNFYIATIMNYQNSSIISTPLFIIASTNIYIDLIILTLSSLTLLSIKQKHHHCP